MGLTYFHLAHWPPAHVQSCFPSPSLNSTITRPETHLSYGPSIPSDIHWISTLAKPGDTEGVRPPGSPEQAMAQG